MSEWNECKLGDVCDISSSKRIFANEYVQNGVPFYRSKEIIEKYNGNEPSTELFISDKRFNEIKEKFGAPMKGDILLTSVGTLGIPCLVRDEEFYFKDGNLTWFKNFTSKCDSQFIYLWLQGNQAKNQIDSKCIGSTQKALTIETLRKFDINLPPLPEQKRIAEILSSLDDKIELNNKMNKNLEEMAQSIFKQWFVNFEFPDENGNPYKNSGGKMIQSELGEIPVGWSVNELVEIVYVQNGYSFKSQDFLDEGTIGIIKIKNINNGKVDIVNTQYVESHIANKVDEKFIVNSGSILIAMTGAEVAKIGIVEKTNKRLYLNQRVGMFKDKKNCGVEYIYCHLTTEQMQEVLRNKAMGSAQPNISASGIESIKIVVPEQFVLDSFKVIIKDIINMVISLGGESNTFEKTRDELLPKLISGEIRV